MRWAWTLPTASKCLILKNGHYIGKRGNPRRYRYLGARQGVEAALGNAGIERGCRCAFTGGNRVWQETLLKAPILQ
jgi:hypothetical protein